MSDYDLIIKNGNLVIPNGGLRKLDIGIKGDKIATMLRGVPGYPSRRELNIFLVEI